MVRAGRQESLLLIDVKEHKFRYKTSGVANLIIRIITKRIDTDIRKL